MNIAIVLWELGVKGGTQRQALELALQLQRIGHLVDVYCYKYDRAQGYTNIFDKLNIYYCVNSRKRKTKAVQNTSGRLASKFRPLLGAAILGKEIFVTGKPVRQLERLIEKTHSLAYYDTINLHDYEVYKVSRILKHKNIVWMMNDLPNPKIKAGSAAMSPLNLLKKIVIASRFTYIKNIKTIVVLDERNRLLCKKTYNRNAIVVRSGIHPNMFTHIPREKHVTNRVYTIFASSIFFPYRRFEDLVDAVELLVKNGCGNISVTINGINERSYDYYLFIKERIIEKNLTSYINITNGLSETELVKQYTHTDIFVFPNNNQTWGLSVFEAMLAGCVCIVSKGAGAHEVLTHAENALLVPPESPQAIADAMLFLIKNPKEMTRIAQNGIQFVKANLSWEKYTKDMLTVFLDNPQK